MLKRVWGWHLHSFIQFSISLSTLYTAVRSLPFLCANVPKFSCFNVTLQIKFLSPGASFVVAFWSFSTFLYLTLYSMTILLLHIPTLDVSWLQIFHHIETENQILFLIRLYTTPTLLLMCFFSGKLSNKVNHGSFSSGIFLMLLLHKV